MKRIDIALITLALILNGCGMSTDSEGGDTGSQAYEYSQNPLGQPPSSTAAELFSPGVISSRLHEHSCLVFTPEADQIFWSIGLPDIHVIMTMKKEGENWGHPAVASFSGNYWDDFPAISPDGGTLFFASKRPLPGQTESDGKYHLWQIQKNADGWSEPAYNGELISGWDVIMPSFTREGVLYFFSNKEGGAGGYDIYRSTPTDDGYSEPENLGTVINTTGHEAFVAVSPDEQYLLFTNWGTSDYDGLMISKMNDAGDWQPPVAVGDALHPQIGIRFYSFSPCGKYLFFNSQFLRSGETMAFSTFDEIAAYAGRVENGNGNFYWVDFDQLITELF